MTTTTTTDFLTLLFPTTAAEAAEADRVAAISDAKAAAAEAAEADRRAEIAEDRKGIKRSRVGAWFNESGAFCPSCGAPVGFACCGN